jgi:hypothetical protein
MSIVFEVTLDDQPVQLEITRDGELIFLDYNITHDLAALEFGYPDTDATELYAEWQESPVGAICYNLGLDEDTLGSLAADWAEHVLPIFENTHQKDKRPRRAIEAARDFVAGKIDRAVLEKAREAASEAAWAAQAAAWAAGATWAAWAAQAASAQAATTAAKAAAWNASSNIGSAEWQQARVIETAWQVRRFVDCMEAIGQGFDWPDIKVTP